MWFVPGSLVVGVSAPGGQGSLPCVGRDQLDGGAHVGGIPVRGEEARQLAADEGKHLVVNEADRRSGSFDVQENRLAREFDHSSTTGFRSSAGGR